MKLSKENVATFSQLFEGLVASWHHKYDWLESVNLPVSFLQEETELLRPSLVSLKGRLEYTGSRDNDFRVASGSLVSLLEWIIGEGDGVRVIQSMNLERIRPEPRYIRWTN